MLSTLTLSTSENGFVFPTDFCSHPFGYGTKSWMKEGI